MVVQKSALFIALLSPLLLSPAYAQRGGGGHAGGGFSGRAVGGGGFRGGYYGGRGFYGGRYWGSGFYFGLGGWGYPYGYYGYPYYGYSPYAYSYDPYAYGGSYPAPSYPAPSYPAPSYPSQSQSRPAPAQQPASDQGQGYYLIAFTDHTIQAATAYKLDGDQFHWITREGQELQIPVSKVDIQFTRQMNRDRNVDFQFP